MIPSPPLRRVSALLLVSVLVASGCREIDDQIPGSGDGGAQPTEAHPTDPQPTASDPADDDDSEAAPSESPSEDPRENDSAAPRSETLCGAAFNVEAEYGDSSYQDAFDRVNGYYDLESVRVFYPENRLQDWPGRLDTDLPMTVSFKFQPRQILSGQEDERLLHWFENAPRDRDIYWVYWHEPENNIQRGDFTAQDYRAAWRHVAKLADRADHPRLHATQVLMAWTAQRQSGRDWRDYYPGDDVLDVLAWDGYTRVTNDVEINDYVPAKQIFDGALRANREADLPFAVAELGSPLAKGDDQGANHGEGRAEWIRETAEFMREQNAVFVQYFDTPYHRVKPTHHDMRLRDDPSQAAWRDFCQGR